MILTCGNFIVALGHGLELEGIVEGLRSIHPGGEHLNLILLI